ncbi:MAG: peptide MFS transporter [Steroidobacteraceae bacterium]
MSGAAPRAFFGHPAGLSTLFFTELWERFSYYGMRALLVLFLVASLQGGGLAMDDTTAYAIYGLYTAGVYIAAMPGGWIADRLLGAQSAVFWGGVLIAAGHLILAVARSQPSFVLGLAVIVLGTGLLKPNCSALVGELYPQGGARRDAAFTIFYLSINIGAVLGPLLTAWLARHYGWHAGFAAAAIGMAVGLVWFRMTQQRLGDAGRRPPGAPPEGPRRRDWIALGVMVVIVLAVGLALWTGLLRLSPLALQRGAIWVILLLAGGYFAYLLLLAGLTAAERRGVLLLLLLVAASSIFWAGYEQAGSALNLFADRYTDRLVGSFEIPTGWFQSVPAAFVILCAPLMAMLWVALEQRGRDLSLVAKFGVGLAGMALGFLVMAGAARVLATTGSSAASFLVLTYFLHTVGELALSPVGMSATTQLVPRRFVGQAMGVWFTSLAMGNLLASRLAGELDGATPEGIAAYFTKMFWIGAIPSLLLLAASPRLTRWARAK